MSVVARSRSRVTVPGSSGQPAASACTAAWRTPLLVGDGPLAEPGHGPGSSRHPRGQRLHRGPAHVLLGIGSGTLAEQATGVGIDSPAGSQRHDRGLPDVPGAGDGGPAGYQETGGWIAGNRSVMIRAASVGHHQYAGLVNWNCPWPDT